MTWSSPYLALVFLSFFLSLSGRCGIIPASQPINTDTCNFRSPDWESKVILFSDLSFIFILLLFASVLFLFLLANREAWHSCVSG